MGKSKLDAVVIGAGPYGLASAAHLSHAGLGLRVFGEPMEFWGNRMPSGMFLRSSWEASSISDPAGSLSLDAYRHVDESHFSEPVPLENFIDYGRWFQQCAIPDLDRRKVAGVEPSSSGFALRLEDGETIEARRVVVAGGIAPFAYRPAVFDELSPSLASHSTDQKDPCRFAGQSVVVIGGGQSAVESAVLLKEAGADVELITRSTRIRWLTRGVWLRRKFSPIRSLLYPPTDVGPPVLNQIVAHPGLFRLFPRGLQARLAYRCIRPAASSWLLPRFEGVRFTSEREVVSAKPDGESLSLKLDDGTSRRVHHALLATGFRVDISKYPFLTRELLKGVKKVNGYPKLKAGFESTVPGLHFVGAPSAYSFGPLMRFVSGTNFAGRELANGIVGRI
jgi:hypothetical protein